jgi:potassium-dependent mechanosensitive channel
MVNQRFALLRVVLLSLLMLLHAATFAGASEPPAFDFDKAQARLKEIGKKIKSGQLSLPQVQEAGQQVEELRKGAEVCIDSAGTRITRIEEETTSLGPAAPHDSPETVKERKSLEKRKQAQQVAQSECRLALTLAARLANDVEEHGKLLQTRGVLSRSDSHLGHLVADLPSAAVLAEQWQNYLRERSGLGDLGTAERLLLVLLLLGGGVVGAGLSRLAVPHALHVEEGTDLRQPSAGSRAMFFLGGAALCGGGYLVYLLQDAATLPYVPWLLLSLAISALTLGLLLPPRPVVFDAVGVPAAGLAATTVLAALLFLVSRLDLGDFPAAARSLDLVRSLVVFTLCLVGCRLFWSLALPSSLKRFEGWRKPALFAAALAIIAAEFAGYRNFTVFVLLALLGTALVVALLQLGLLLIDRAVGGFLPGRYRWQRRLRERLGLFATDSLPSISWLRLLGKFLAWGLALIFFLHFWGVSDAMLKKISAIIIDGFSLGDLKVVPARLILGVFIFAAGWTLFSWLRLRLERTWLDQAGFSQSAQDTLVTITGYCGFAIALLIGLSMAGFSFSNLAVIAGALSVGIGFGLQNVVNNFVSGLIILFERPVKRGDWIRIGTTEGYVQRISVRSTLIQTFDRSDVIVPNSELISNQVTNMTLNDNFGRLIVPVSVAYGSDTELVRRLLEEIAAGIPEVINDESAPRPVALFLSFGESSLNFELRCHLANIDRRLAIKSAINFTIDRVFREHHIQMPFPQRDIYIKEFPAMPGAKVSSPPADSIAQGCDDARD